MNNERSSRLGRVMAGIVALAAAGAAQAGTTTWIEVGDAGQNGPGAAQVPSGSGVLDTIIGSCTDGNDVDVYAIMITDYQAFSATTINVANWDTQLFLFNADGTGQAGNDDFGGTFQSTITSQGVFANGLYYIAISRFNARPLNGSGQFLFTGLLWPGPDEQQFRANDGSGAFASWSSGNGFTAGDYCILLTGASYVPAPGAFALLGLAGLVARPRRRR